jgi:hypothetical protein
MFVFTPYACKHPSARTVIVIDKTSLNPHRQRNRKTASQGMQFAQRKRAAK